MSVIEDLIVRSLQGNADAVEQEHLRRWRARAGENELKYQEVAAVWSLTGIGSSETSGKPALDGNVVIALAEFLGRGERKSSASPTGSPQYVDRGKYPRLVAWTGLLAASLAGLGFGVGHISGGSGSGANPLYSEIVTGENEMATFALADGTAIRVGPESTLRLFHDGDDATVWLDGLAFFGVEPDPSRTFTVRTKHGDAMALGTRFEVRSQEHDFRVLVVEGNVRVSASGAAVELSEGLMTESRDGAPPSTARVLDVDELLDWMGTTLMYRNTPVRRAVAEIGRRYGIQILLDDPALAELTITATFTDQAVESVILVICEMIGAQHSVDEDGRIHIRQKTSALQTTTMPAASG